MAYEPQFLAPQGRGRPIEDTDLPMKIGSFLPGVDSYFDQMTVTANCHIAINNDCFQGRTLDKRKGYTRLGADTPSGKVYHLGSLEQMNGNDIMLRIVEDDTDVKLQKYTSSWADVGAAWGDSNSLIDHFGVSTVIGGEERYYFTNGVDTLRYTEGTSITTVEDDGTPIIGKFITAVENVLVLGNLGAPFSSNQLVWSKAGTHQFRRDVDATFADSSYLVTLDGEITQLVTLGWLVYAFTASNGLWELDLTTGIPRAISTHGTLSPKSVAVGHNTMIWADQYNIWGLVLGGNIQKLGDPIKNIYKEIDSANIANLNACITPEGKYKLWVGDLTYEGVSYSDVLFSYDIEKSRDSDSLIWRVSDNYKSNYWTKWTNSSDFTLAYFGAYDEDNVYADESGTTDGGADITTTWQSKDFPVVDEKKKLTLKDIYLKVKPDNAASVTIAVYVRVDMGAWQDLGDITVASSALDMVMYRLQGQPGIIGRTLAVKLVITGAIDFKIYEMLITTNQTIDELRPTTNA